MRDGLIAYLLAEKQACGNFESELIEDRNRNAVSVILSIIESIKIDDSPIFPDFKFQAKD